MVRDPVMEVALLDKHAWLFNGPGIIQPSLTGNRPSAPAEIQQADLKTARPPIRAPACQPPPSAVFGNIL